MNIKEKHKLPGMINWSLAMPIWTFIIAGSMFVLSNFYRPNWSFDWTGIRPEIRDSVELLEKYTEIPSHSTGNLGKTPQHWYTRRWIMKNANQGELLKLKNYPDGAIKATAYEALLIKSNMQFELLKEALNDTVSFFNYQSGCVGVMMMPGEYLIEQVVGLENTVPFPPPGLNQHISLTASEINALWELYLERREMKWQYFARNYDWRK